MAKDYAAITKSILENCGGVKNVISVSHCMTRLRLQMRDTSKFDTDSIKKIPGVLNVVLQNGEHQIVIGQDVPSLYEDFLKIEGIKAGGSVEDAEALKEDTQNQKGRVMNAILSFIGGTFSPVIPVLVAGGLTGAVLTLLTNFAGVTTESGTYTIIYAINQAAFYFLPIFIGFSAATRLKANGYLGAFLGAILLYSTINNAEGLSFFGIGVAQVTYNSTVFPIILGTLFMSVIYKFLQKHIPVFLRTVFVPLITILVTVPVTLIVLGPIGDIMGTALSNGLYAIYKAVPAIAVMIVGITTPLMVFFGMNNATYPIVFALIAEVGSDPLICTGMAPANVAVGGACLAAALIAKDVNERSVSASAGITALCGITEPGVYGVLFPKTYPLIGAMIGGGIGGLIAGFMGMTQYAISTPGFISIPAYMNPDGSSGNLIISVVVMVVALVAGFLITYFLGRKFGSKASEKRSANERAAVAANGNIIAADDERTAAAKNEGTIVTDKERAAVSDNKSIAAADNKRIAVSDDKIIAIADAKQILIEQVGDKVFSDKMMGDGIAFELESGTICAPANGVLSVLYPTGHAFGITMNNQVELLCHIGINTVESKGAGFKLLKSQGDVVKAGDPIVQVDIEALSKTYDMTTMLIVTDAKGKQISFQAPGKVRAGQIVGSVN